MNGKSGNRQGRQGKPSFPQIRIGFTEPEKAGKVYESTLSAFVRRGNQPQEGVDIQFYIDYVPIDVPVKTVHDGRATLQVTNLTSPRSYRVAAQIVGTSTKDETMMQIRPKKKLTAEEKLLEKELADIEHAAKLAKLRLEATQPALIIPMEAPLGDGKFHIIFQVLASDGRPVIEAVVNISSPSQGFCNLEPTDKKGVVKCEVTVPDGKDEMFLQVSVLGSKVSTWMNLYR